MARLPFVHWLATNGAGEALWVPLVRLAGDADQLGRLGER